MCPDPFVPNGPTSACRVAKYFRSEGQHFGRPAGKRKAEDHEGQREPVFGVFLSRSPVLSLAARGIARGAGAAKGVPAVLESFSFASTGYALFPMFHHQDSSVDDIPGAVHALCFSARPRAPSPMVSWVLSCWPPGGEKSSVSCRSMFGSFFSVQKSLDFASKNPQVAQSRRYRVKGLSSSRPGGRVSEKEKTHFRTSLSVLRRRAMAQGYKGSGWPWQAGQGFSTAEEQSTDLREKRKRCEMRGAFVCLGFLVMEVKPISCSLKDLLTCSVRSDWAVQRHPGRCPRSR